MHGENVVELFLDKGLEDILTFKAIVAFCGAESILRNTKSGNNTKAYNWPN